MSIPVLNEAFSTERDKNQRINLLIKAVGSLDSNATQIIATDYVVGDGEADDYAALAEAVAAANAIGADLIIPPGCQILINMTGSRMPIALTNCRIVGSGKAQQWFNSDSTKKGSWFLIKGTSASPFTMQATASIVNMSWLWPDQLDPASLIVYPPAISSIGVVSISYCALKGNVFVNPYIAVDCGTLASGFNIFADNMICPLLTGIQSGNSLAETWITRNDFSWAAGQYFYTALGKLSALQAQVSGNARAVLLTGVDTDAWFINDNCFFNMHAGVYGTNGSVDGYYWGTINDNTFDACYFGIFFEAKFRPASCVVSGNTFNNQINGDATATHIRAQVTSVLRFDLTITGNLFSVSPGSHIVVTDSQSQVANVTISGNTFLVQGNSTNSTCNSVNVNGPLLNLVATGNKFDAMLSPSARAFAIAGANNVALTGNHIEATATAFLIAGAIAGSLLIMGNTVFNVSTVIDFTGGSVAGMCVLAPNAFSNRVNAQTGTSYMFTPLDAGGLVTFNNASAVAASLSQAINAFGSGFYTDVKNLGAGDVTITPATSTIGGSATLVLHTGDSARIWSDGANYQVTSTSISAATTSAKGIVELATGAEALGGSDSTRAVTSAALASSQSVSSSGYTTLPGGIIIQWGDTGAATTGSVTFPLAFPNNLFAITFGQSNADRITSTTARSLTGFSYSNTIASTGGATVNHGTWIAIGN